MNFFHLSSLYFCVVSIPPLENSFQLSTQTFSVQRFSFSTRTSTPPFFLFSDNINLHPSIPCIHNSKISQTPILLLPTPYSRLPISRNPEPSISFPTFSKPPTYPVVFRRLKKLVGELTSSTTLHYTSTYFLTYLLSYLKLRGLEQGLGLGLGLRLRCVACMSRIPRESDNENENENEKKNLETKKGKDGMMRITRSEKRKERLEVRDEARRARRGSFFFPSKKNLLSVL